MWRWFRRSTRGPAWGPPSVVLGTTVSFLQPFCGNLSPKIDTVSDFEIPPRRALRGEGGADPAGSPEWNSPPAEYSVCLCLSLSVSLSVSLSFSLSLALSLSLCLSYPLSLSLPLSLYFFHFLSLSLFLPLSLSLSLCLSPSLSAWLSLYIYISLCPSL